MGRASRNKHIKRENRAVREAYTMRVIVEYLSAKEGESKTVHIENAKDIGINTQTGLFTVINSNGLPVFSTLVGRVVGVAYPDHDTSIELVPQIKLA